MPDLPQKQENLPQGVEEFKAKLGIGESNTSYGTEAGVRVSGTKNAFFGNGAGKETSSGKENTLLGSLAGHELDTGAQNTLVGASAGATVSSGGKNTFLGVNAGNSTTGSSNVFIGFKAGESEGNVSNKLLVANNGTTAIITGVMSETAASNELGLGTNGGKIGFLAVAAAPVEAKTTGAETTAAIWARLKELGLTL